MRGLLLFVFCMSAGFANSSAVAQVTQASFAPAPAITPIDTGTIELKVRATPSDIWLYTRRPGETSRTRLCAGECTLRLARGEYIFALGRPEHRPREVKLQYNLTENASLDGRYESRRRLRRAGGALIGLGVVAAVTATVLGFLFAQMESNDDSLCTVNSSGDCVYGHSDRLSGGAKGVLAGVSLFGIAALASGFVLVTRRDRAQLQVLRQP